MNHINLNGMFHGLAIGLAIGLAVLVLSKSLGAQCQVRGMGRELTGTPATLLVETSDPSNSQANLEPAAACKDFASCISLQVAHARSRQVLIPRSKLHDFGRSKTSGSCLICLGWPGECLNFHKLRHWHLDPDDHLGQERSFRGNRRIFPSSAANV